MNNMSLRIRNTFALRTGSGIMGVDAVGYVSCIYIAAIGAENRMIIDPVDIFSTAVIHKSKKVFLAHNHPNEGVDSDLSLTLSPEDFDFTNRLYHACQSFGIEVMDHIILSDETYYSLDENKYMTLIH